MSPPSRYVDALRRHTTPWTLLVLAAVAAGLALRAAVLASPLGALESDEAIVGLMARRALDGDVSVFYWGALYGGTQEALLSAAVFAVTGSSVLVLKLVSLSIYALAGVLTWRVGRRTVGEPAARIGAALFWIWPPFLVWWSTKARGYFGSGLVLGLFALLLVLRLHARPTRRDAALLGFVLGLGIWATLQTFLLALPALAWLVWRRVDVVRLVPFAIPPAIVGAAPWLVWNARNGWNAVLPQSIAGADTSYLGRLADLFGTVLPTWLGLRTSYSLDWVTGRPVGVALLVLAVAGFVVITIRRPPRSELLAVTALAFPFLYAASSFTFFLLEPRYLVFIAPVPALLVGSWIARSGLVISAAALLAAAGLSVTGLVLIERQGGYRALAEDARVPTNIAPLLALLEREHANRVLANYWIAYRISFESRERVVATSTGFVRDQRSDRLVRRTAHPARVYVVGAAAEARARPDLERRGFRRLTAGGFVVYVFGRPA